MPTVIKSLKGKDAYEVWKEIPGNENKTLQQYHDEMANNPMILSNDATYFTI